MPIEIVVCALFGVIVIQNILWNKERKSYIHIILSGDRHILNENTKPIKKVTPKYKKVLNKWRNGKDSE